MVNRHVLLPHWIVDKSNKDQDTFKRLIIQYLDKGYPNYTVKKVKWPYAICVRENDF